MRLCLSAMPSLLRRRCTKYASDNGETMIRQIITQSHAARIRGCERQWIHELIQKGRLSVPVDTRGRPRHGMVYADEVTNLAPAKKGRPPLSDAEAKAKNPALAFSIGEEVLWRHVPQGGFGYHVFIPCRVEKHGQKKVRVSFEPLSDAQTERVLAWADPEELLGEERLAELFQLEAAS